jgi:Protein of unknown function (DUF3141)
MPGQTIEDIGRAEAVFLEKVSSLHPEADGKPCVIGNCQAGLGRRRSFLPTMPAKRAPPE